MMGTYELQPGNRIRFTKMAGTLMACQNMEIEDQLRKVLEMADNYNLDGDKLVLNKARMAPLARFEAVYLR
jgi:heat shock protein HslJ